MVDRYAHIRLEAKRSALEALSTHQVTVVTDQCFIDDRGNPKANTVTRAVTGPETLPLAGGYGTTNDTKGGHDGPPSLQVIDSIGRRVGI